MLLVIVDRNAILALIGQSVLRPLRLAEILFAGLEFVAAPTLLGWIGLRHETIISCQLEFVNKSYPLLPLRIVSLLYSQFDRLPISNAGSQLDTGSGEFFA